MVSAVNQAILANGFVHGLYLLYGECSGSNLPVRQHHMNDLFFKKLRNAVQSRSSTTLVLLSPAFEKMPLPMQRYDEPFLPFGKAIIDATHDLVAGYVFDLEAYLIPGAAGMIALERTISYLPSDLIEVLPGAFSTTAMTPGITLTMNTDSISGGRPALI